MGLYNMFFGNSAEQGDALAKILGFESRSDLGRFRDCWVEEQDGEPVIAFHCRNGLGNRSCWNEDYAKTDEERDICNSAKCDCVGCTQSYRLPAHPLYIRDEDNDFDGTYCTTWFRVPDGVKAELKSVAIERPDITGNWMALFAALEGKKPA